MNENISFCVLADTHLLKSSTEEASRLLLLKRLLKAIAQRDPVALLVAGDVTDEGESAAWDDFWRALDHAGLFDRVAVIPGNRDARNISAWKRWPTEEELETMRRCLARGRQPSTFPWARVFDNRLAVFGLNTNVGGAAPLLTNSIGYVSGDDLNRLQQLFEAHKNVPAKVLLMHHRGYVPRSVERMWRDRFQSDAEAAAFYEQKRNRCRLRLLAKEYGVSAIFFGHIHFLEDVRRDGLRIVGCPAALGLESPDLIFLDCRIAPRAVRIHVVSEEFRDTFRPGIGPLRLRESWREQAPGETTGEPPHSYE